MSPLTLGGPPSRMELQNSTNLFHFQCTNITSSSEAFFLSSYTTLVTAAPVQDLEKRLGAQRSLVIACLFIFSSICSNTIKYSHTFLLLL